MLTPPNGLPANAPSFDYFRTQVYFDRSRRGAREAGQKVANLFASAELKPLPRAISQLANGAMLTVVVGQTFHGSLASAPIDQTPKRERPERRLRARTPRSTSCASAAGRVPFPLMVPTVIERSSWTDSTMPAADVLDRRGGEAQGRALVYRMGSNEYWGVQMTDWDGAPVLADKSLTRRIGGRVYDLYYNGPKLHMVVLNTPKADYWVVNTVLDRLSNETMLAIAKGLRPLGSVKEDVAPMKVAVFGAGYVGLVTGACFAELGHDVVVRDVVEAKVDALRAGVVPIHEPGLDEILARNARASALHHRGRGGGRRRRRRLHRGRHAADLLGRRGSLRRLDCRRRAPAGRPPDRPRDEEHRPRRHGSRRAPSARRPGSRERGVRVESGVHRRGYSRAGLHAPRPDRDRRVR